MLQELTYRDVKDFTLYYWRRRVKLGLAALGLMTAATVVDAFVPIYTGKVVDALVQAESRNDRALYSAGMFLAIFAGLQIAFNLLRWGAILCWNYFAVRNMAEIISEALYKVQRFSADWHANTFAGGTVRKITRGLWSFDLFGDTLYMGLYPAAIIMVAVNVIMFWHLPLVGAFTFVMIVIYVGVSIWLAVRVQAPLFDYAAQCDTKIGATLADIITGNPTVKAFGREEREDTIFGRVARHWRLRSQKAWCWGEHVNLIRGLIRTTMLIGMVGITAVLWRYGRASAGDIAFALMAFFLIGGYLRDIGQHITNLQKSISEMEDIIAFWKREDAVKDAPDAKPLVIDRSGGPAGEIVFDRVRFAYSDQQAPLFDGLDVHIAPGERVALVGASGSGKSSFVKLIQRLYDVDSGAIRIDGQNIAQVTQSSLRRQIALVPQEPILFHRPLAENIAYAKPDASRNEVVEAAKKAYAHDFITKLPQGYGTLVGERGVKLSGGERQRVAIARAVLADAPILILDEATSSLDSISEHYIQLALEDLMQGRTTITVAHRLSTIKGADRILVFDAGRIVEQGTHDTLIARRDSYYRALYDMQAMGLHDSRDAYTDDTAAE